MPRDRTPPPPWETLHRSAAERVIAKVWQPTHAAALVMTEPALPTRRDHRTARHRGAPKPPTASQVEAAFGTFWPNVFAALDTANPDIEAARQRCADAGFADNLRIAATPAEAVAHLAEFFARGHNVWCDGGSDRVLWIRSWRE